MHIFNFLKNPTFLIFKDNILYRGNTLLNVLSKRIVCIAASAFAFFIAAYYILRQICFKATDHQAGNQTITNLNNSNKENVQNVADSILFFEETKDNFPGLKPLTINNEVEIKSREQLTTDNKDDNQTITNLNNQKIVQNVANLKQDSSSSDIMNYCEKMGEKLEELTLGTAKLKDTDIETICKFCPNLKNLKWNYEGVSDACLEKLKVLKLLKYLDLSGCKQITDKGLQHLENCIHLKSLNLSRCWNITDNGLKSLGNLISLEVLYLGGCKITDNGLQHLKTLKSLRILDLSYCAEITDDGLESLIKDLKLLNKLDLSYCIKLTKLQCLKKLEFLEYLKLKGCVEIKKFEDLKDLVSLQSLDLSYCSQITNEDLQYLKELKKLKYLYLVRCTVTDPGIEYLKDLKLLELDLTLCREITNEALKLLKDCISLKILILSGCYKLNDEGLDYLKNLTSLEALYLGIWKITDERLKKLVKTLKSLNYLNLKGCKNITQGVVKDLKKDRENLQVILE